MTSSRELRFPASPASLRSDCAASPPQFVTFKRALPFSPFLSLLSLLVVVFFLRAATLLRGKDDRVSLRRASCATELQTHACRPLSRSGIFKRSNYTAAHCRLCRGTCDTRATCSSLQLCSPFSITHTVLVQLLFLFFFFLFLAFFAFYCFASSQSFGTCERRVLLFVQKCFPWYI